MKRWTIWATLFCLCLTLLFVTTKANAVNTYSGSYGAVQWVLDNGTLTISGNGAIPESAIWYDGKNNRYCSSHPWQEYYSSITTIVIEPGVTSIGCGAFIGLNKVTSLTIPSSVTSIGNDAFAGCSGLKSVVFPSSIRSIGEYAFGGCSGLSSIYTDSITSWLNIKFEDVGSNPLSYAHSLYVGGVPVTELVIPDGVTSIGNYAFCGGSELTSVTIPDSVTSIGTGAFKGCIGIKQLVIPESVTYFGSGMLAECSHLENLTIPCVTWNYKNSGDFYRMTFAWLFGWESGPDLESVYQIAEGAGNYSLTLNRYIPSSLHTVTVTGGNVGFDAFRNCTMLTDVKLPEDLSSIGAQAFMGCSNLMSITIPDTVTTIGKNAFYGSGYYEDASNWENDVLYLGSVLLKATSLYGVYQVKGGTTVIADGAFSSCHDIDCIIFPYSIKGIGADSISGLSSDSIVFLPNGLSATNFLGRVFRDYDEFLEAAFSKGYMSINDYSEGTVTIINGQSTMPKWYKRGEEQTITFIPDVGYDFSAAALDGKLLDGPTFTVPDKESFSLDVVLAKKYDASAGGACGDGLYWCVTTDNELVIYGSGIIPDYNSGGAPWYSNAGRIERIVFDGCVTGIGSYAFENFKALKEVAIPGTVKSVGDGAFRYCSNLQNVIISEGVEIIGYGGTSNVFQSCSGLLFQNGGYIVMPSTLSSVYWPLNYIDSDVFYIGGGNTDELAVDSINTKWHRISSLDDIAELHVESVDGGTVTLSKMFAAPGDTITLTFDPNPGYKLYSFLLLTSTGPKAVGSEYTIPSGGSYTFGAKTIAPKGEVISGTVGTNAKYWIADGEAHIYGTGATKNYSFNYTTGSYHEFSPLYSKTGFSKVVIEDGITEIGTALFYMSYDIKEIEIASSVTRIGTYAFAGLPELESVTLPEGLSVIQSNAFYQDYALKSVYIPGSVTQMAMSTFTGTAVKTAGPVDSGCDIIFGWTESIPANAFENAPLEKVILPDTITSIGAGAFKNYNPYLKSINLPAGLQSIGADAFSGCTALKTAGGESANVVLSPRETLGSEILSAFPSLERIDVPEGTEAIADNAFSSLNNLKVVAINSGVKTIGAKAFSGCEALTAVSLPQSLTSLGTSAFENCKSLRIIQIPTNLNEIVSGTFTDCSSLKRVVIPKALTTIAMSAFNGCTSLTDVYYGGTADEWKDVMISPLLNDPILNAHIHYADEAFVPVSAAFSSAAYDGSSVTATLEYDWCYSDMDVFVAIYQDGRLIAIGAARATADDEASTVVIPVSKLEGSYQVKAFFLGTADSAPLGASLETSLTA